MLVKGFVKQVMFSSMVGSFLKLDFWKTQNLYRPSNLLGTNMIDSFFSIKYLFVIFTNLGHTFFIGFLQC